jgi:hypothetical protein
VNKFSRAPLEATAAMVAVLVLAAGAWSQTPDYSTIKKQTQLFETVLETGLRQHFDTEHFLMMQVPRGAYLEGYGVVFTLEVDLYRMRYRNPFDASPYSEKEVAVARAAKLARMKELEILVRDLLRNNGMGLDFVSPDENVAVVVHLFNQAEHKDLPSQLAVQTKKQWLQEAAGRRLSAAEFRQKLSVISF